jgi:sucrose phosphorylase
MARDDLRYLLARAIQFFLPGVPQVYYVGLFAGGNDVELLARTDVGRDINRHHYTRSEIEAALNRTVVQDLFTLIRLRNSHPAFAGRFEMLDSPEHSLLLRWVAGDDIASLQVNLATGEHCITCTGFDADHCSLLNLVAARPVPAIVAGQ